MSTALLILAGWLAAAVIVALLWSRARTKTREPFEDSGADEGAWPRDGYQP